MKTRVFTVAAILVALAGWLFWVAPWWGKALFVLLVLFQFFWAGQCTAVGVYIRGLFAGLALLLQSKSEQKQMKYIGFRVRSVGSGEKIVGIYLSAIHTVSARHCHVFSQYLNRQEETFFIAFFLKPPGTSSESPTAPP